MKEKNAINQTSRPTNLAYLNHGRIPVVEKDLIPSAYITVQKAERINTALNQFVDSIQSMISEVRSYSSSAKYLLENLKERNDEESEKLRDLHKRLLGGTLLSMINANLESMDITIQGLKSKVNGGVE
jgi:methyl-accepting chemotaxis protein